MTTASTAAPPVPALVAGSDRVSLRDPVFISDLHLCAARPLTLARFFSLLGSLAGHAGELVILGDLFEYWAGDDTLQDPLQAPLHEPPQPHASGESSAESSGDDSVAGAVVQALRELAARGMPVHVMHGNRDVLLGQQFLQQSGASLLADPAIALIGGSVDDPVLLSHGDAYCTLDVAYQAFRRQARDARFQGAFLARPLAERRALIGQARALSESGKQQLAMQIMDVTPEAIAQAMDGAHVRRMIHGHTHRPARHDFALGEAAAVRWVLPDWDLDGAPARGGGIRLVAGALQPFAL